MFVNHRLSSWFRKQTLCVDAESGRTELSAVPARGQSLLHLRESTGAIHVMDSL